MTASQTRERAAMRRALALAATAGVPLGPEPARRLRARSTPTARRSPRATTAAPAPARRGRRAGPGRRGRPRRHRRGHPRALQPHRPHRPVRRGAGRGRRTPRGLRPAPTPTRSPPGAPTPCARPASRSRAGLLADEARALNRVWTFAVEHGRPFVTWKFATTLDGRSAAADGTSRWVSSRGRPRATPTGCGPCATRCWSAPTPSPSTTPRLTVRDDDGPAARRSSRCAR